MNQRITNPPTKPGIVIRHALLVTVLTALSYLLWVIVERTSVHTPWPQPGPPAQAPKIATLAVATAWVAALIVAAVRHQLWRAAMETQKVYEAIARVLRLPLNERARMKVKARDGLVPNDVRVRVDSVTAARDDRARQNLVRAFADATGEPVDRVRVEQVKRGVHLWIERPAEVHEPDDYDDYDEPDTPNTEPKIAPVPARPANNRTQARITAAMRGALGSEGVQSLITDTHDDGSPEEVWVEYPPELAAKVRGQLKAVLDTITLVNPARRDSWGLRLVGTHDRIILNDRIDPLAVMVDLPDVDPNPDLEKGVKVGLTESGADWLLPLMGGAHVLIAGTTGAGKGSVLWNMLRQLAPMIADGRVRLWCIDPKRGMEFSIIKTVCARFAVEEDEQLALLREFKTVMDAKGSRLAAAGLRKIPTPITTAMPVDLLLIDELANVSKEKGVEELIKEVLQLGRASGATVIGAMQDPKVAEFKHRASFTFGVALRLREARQTNMVLGDGARANGALADCIPSSLPGVGYVVTGESEASDRVRCAYVSDPETEKIAEMMGVDLAERAATLIPLDATPIEEPIERTPQGVPVRITALNEMPVRARFDRDPEPMTILSWENSEEPDRILVTYAYDGEGPKVTDVDDTETVTLVP